MLKEKRTVRRRPMTPRSYKVGDIVYGLRAPTAHAGTFVRAYVTINNGWRNPAYVIKCDVDGKERSFQILRPQTKSVSEYTVIK